MEAMLLGALALVLLTVSCYCLYHKKSVFALICGITSITATYLTGYHWREMLKDSGKDTALLGFNRYPLVVIILAALMLVALVIFLVCVVKIVKEATKR